MESFILRPTTPIEIEELCLGLESGKGMGWDGVSPRVIKGVARELAGSLSRLFNCCMREGYYPTCFKISRIVPVFKAEDPTEFSNYRPVAVLPVLSQIFERVIHSRLVQFLDRNKVTIPGQYGFRSGHSTAMAILDMVEKVRGAWGRGNRALGVFIDLKKAFDTVDHDILLAKLEHYGVRGVSLEFFRSYLRGRSQYVTYGGYESERGPLDCGVPQGSVLGPLFFLLYVNDMGCAGKGLEFILFADDTNIFAEGRDLSELIRRVNKGLESLSAWFRCNKLTLNLKKTEYIYFRNTRSDTATPEGLQIGGEIIRRVEGTRFLGVWIDEGLKWSVHITNVKTKVSQLLGVLGRARAVLRPNVLRSIYNGLVLPHLQYCLMVWGDFSGGRNTTIGNTILKYQKQFAGMIAGKYGKYHADPLFSRFGMLKIEDLYKQQLRIHAWQCWNKLLPENQTAILHKVSDTHSYSTRSAELGFSLSTRDKHSISYRVPKEWSLLSAELKSKTSLAAFKRHSKQQFIRAYGSFACKQVDCRVCLGWENVESTETSQGGQGAG